MILPQSIADTSSAAYSHGSAADAPFHLQRSTNRPPPEFGIIFHIRIVFPFQKIAVISYQTLADANPSLHIRNNAAAAG